MGTTTTYVNPSDKLTLSVTASSIDGVGVSYAWTCPTSPSVLSSSSSNVLSSTSSQYLVLAKGSLNPWAVTSGKFNFKVTASDSVGNASATVRGRGVRG